jgi:dTDP-glucose pyrophosphorylase
MACIDRNAKGIALVVDEDRHLIDTVSDGDIRRAILAGTSLETPVSELLAHKVPLPHAEPITAPLGCPQADLLRTMQESSVRQIPLIDPEGRVADLVTLNELLPKQSLPVQAVIMAGGFGNRLRPLTEDLPKPMLPVGGRPLMERIVEQLRDVGIHQLSVTTHYKPEVIADHFGDGSQFGVKIDYVREEQPLGTAGALGMIDQPEGLLLVMNGDIVTQLNFRAMVDFHHEHKADMTVAVRKFDFQVPFGVVETEGVLITGLAEKPSLGFFVNAGIYLLEPTAHRNIPRGQRFDMTDLIDHLLAEKRRVVSFPIREYWLDIGHDADYEQAQDDLKNGRI